MDSSNDNQFQPTQRQVATITLVEIFAKDQQQTDIKLEDLFPKKKPEGSENEDEIDHDALAQQKLNQVVQEEKEERKDQSDPLRNRIQQRKSKEIEKPVTQTETIGDVAKTGSLVVVGSSLAGGAVTSAGLAAAGFSSSGVVAGSMAVAIQSSIGNVAAGSLFALAQATAAGGASTLIVPSLVLGGIGGSIFLGVKLIGRVLKNNGQNQEQIKEEPKGEPQDGEIGDGVFAQNDESVIIDKTEIICEEKGRDLGSQSIAMDGISAIVGTAQNGCNKNLSGAESVEWGQVQHKVGSIIKTGSSMAMDGVTTVGEKAQQVGGFIKSEIQSIDWANVRDKAGSVIESGQSIAKQGAEITGASFEKVGDTAKKVYGYSWSKIQSVFRI